MLSFDDAFQIVLDSAGRLQSEKIPLGDCLNRILAEDIASDMNMPPHNMSAMDGYACRQSDLHSPLEEIETIPAGYMPHETVQMGLHYWTITRNGADFILYRDSVNIKTASDADFLSRDLKYPHDAITWIAKNRILQLAARSRLLGRRI